MSSALVIIYQGAKDCLGQRFNFHLLRDKIRSQLLFIALKARNLKIRSGTGRWIHLLKGDPKFLTFNKVQEIEPNFQGVKLTIMHT